jgi:hypothetical protein
MLIVKRCRERDARHHRVGLLHVVAANFDGDGPASVTKPLLAISSRPVSPLSAAG